MEESPYRSATDSPSRQLLWELGQLQISDQASFYRRLDRDGAKLDAAYREALDAAARQHERVRRGAEATREREELEIQIAEDQRRANELRQLDRLRRERAEHELRVERERVAAARAAEEAEREAAAARKALADAEEGARREKERRAAEERERIAAADKREAERRAAEAEEEARKKQAALLEEQRLREEQQQQQQQQRAREEAQKKQQTAPSPQNHFPATSSVQPSTSSLSSAPLKGPVPVRRDREAEHQRYLQIHQRLKALRRSLDDLKKQDPNLKKAMGDSRRTIRKCVGQLTGIIANNKQPLTEIIKTLRSSLATARPQFDVRDFLFSPPSTDAPAQAPGLLLYLLNIFAKAVISQFATESGVSPKSANAIGIVGSSIFAQQDFLWAGQTSLIDIFVAKLHVVCPVVFGIYGDEDTSEGKRRLGWKVEDGAFVTPQRHSERMTGLGAGFAAMSLRSYEKSKLANPFPQNHWWRAVADITNTPPHLVTPTHFIVLKALIEYNEARVLEFFGNMGKAALRRALVDFPNKQGIKPSVASKSVALLADVAKRELKLFL